MANYENEVCRDCMYCGKDDCKHKEYGKDHKACEYFK